MKNRTCTKCNKEFPATDEYFYRRKTRHKGLLSICKACAKISAHKGYRNNPEPYKLRSAVKHKNSKLYFINLKGGRCQICGYNECIGALEFHHTDPSIKEYNILCVGRQKAIKELKKCILVCANCHRKIHYSHEC